jgi:hypothetical protein
MELSPLINMPTTGPDRESQNGPRSRRKSSSTTIGWTLTNLDPFYEGNVPEAWQGALSQHPSPIMMLLPLSVGAIWTWAKR